MELRVIQEKGKFYIIGIDGKKQTRLSGPYNSQNQAMTYIGNNADQFKQWMDNTDYTQKNKKLTYQRNLNKKNIIDPIKVALDSSKLELHKTKVENEKLKLEIAKNDTIKKPIAKIPVGILDNEFLTSNGYVIPKDSTLKFYDQKDLDAFNDAKVDFEVNKEKINQAKFDTKSDSLSVELDKQKLQNTQLSDSLGLEIDKQNLEIKEKDLAIKEQKYDHQAELNKIQKQIKQLEATTDSLGVVNKKKANEIQLLKEKEQKLKNEILKLKKEKEEAENLITANSSGKPTKKLKPSEIDSIIKNYKKAGTSFIMNKRLGKDTTANRHTMDLYKKQLLDYDKDTYGVIFSELEREYDTIVKDIEEYNNKSAVGKWFDRTFSW